MFGSDRATVRNDPAALRGKVDVCDLAPTALSRAGECRSRPGLVDHGAGREPRTDLQQLRELAAIVNGFVAGTDLA